MDNHPPRWDPREFAGFPPGRDYVLLPRRPRRAAAAGLALYDPSLAHQRLAATAGRLMLPVGLALLLPVRGEPHLPDRTWWEHWLTDVAVPEVGPVAATAFRAGHALTGNPPRISALLIDREGRPRAFAKFAPAAVESQLGVAALRLLAASEADAFRVPRLLGTGKYGGAEYLLQEPMPTHHVGAGRRPDLLAAVTVELQRRLASLERPAGTADHHVPVHTAVSPANLRRDRSGSVWLIDWDKARWGPPLTDLLRYWLAYYARRPGPRRRRARRVVELVTGRGTADQAREALAWRIAFREREPDRPQQRIRDTVAGVLGVS